jgi:hypothetical protein
VDSRFKHCGFDKMISLHVGTNSSQNHVLCIKNRRSVQPSKSQTVKPHYHAQLPTNHCDLESQVDGGATDDDKAAEVVASATNGLPRAIFYVREFHSPAVDMPYQLLPDPRPIAVTGSQVRPTGILAPTCASIAASAERAWGELALWTELQQY